MFNAVKLCVRLETLWMVKSPRPATAIIGPYWVAMLKDAATIKAAPPHEITPIIGGFPKPRKAPRVTDRGYVPNL